MNENNGVFESLIKEYNDLKQTIKDLEEAKKIAEEKYGRLKSYFNEGLSNFRIDPEVKRYIIGCLETGEKIEGISSTIRDDCLGADPLETQVMFIFRIRKRGH